MIAWRQYNSSQNSSQFLLAHMDTEAGKKKRSKGGRRANGDGWVYKDGSQWRVKVPVATDPVTGKVRYRGGRFATHKEALDGLRRLQMEARNGVLKPVSQRNFGTFLEDWLETFIRSRKAPTTYRQYRWLVDQHILPHLGSKRIEQIQRSDIQTLINLKAQQRVSARSGDTVVSEEERPLLSKSTLRLIRAVLHSALEYAVRTGLIGANPSAYVDLPVAPKQPVVVLKPEEAARLFAAAAKSELSELWQFLLSTGTRIGEATGVRWQDIDLSAGTVVIRGQLQRQEGRLLYRPSTKTNTVRTLALSTKLVTAMTELREVQRKAGVADPEGIAFLNPQGRRLDPKYVGNHLKKLCRAAEVPEVSPHKLRHTAATLALAATGDLYAVKTMLGHKQIRLTADTYGHAVDQSHRKLASAIEQALSPE